MNRVFVDTGGFYAALNRRDASHRAAARLFRRAQREHWFLFTTNVVLAESHALILARAAEQGGAVPAGEVMARLRKAVQGPRAEPAVWDKSLDRPLFPEDSSA